MVDLVTIEQDLQAAVKSRDALTVDTLRGLKTRMQNEQIAQGQPLTEEQVIQLIRSEVKRRKDAIEAYETGGRAELAQKEREEAGVLEKYLPAQASEEQVTAKIDELIAANSWTIKDFGAAMGKLKQEFGSSADGATLARVLKEKLK
jgi:uncharacterized protein